NMAARFSTRRNWPIDPGALPKHIRWMFRIAVLGALLLACCSQKKGSAPDAASAPAGFRAPTLKCSFVAPAGWAPSAAPMPDCVAEMVATAPSLRGRMVVREAVETDVGLATEEQKQRTVAAWGSQPDFTLLREDPMGEGRLLAYQWRPRPSAPIERHLVAVLPLEAAVIVAFIDDDGATPESHLLATLSTLSCRPRQEPAPGD
ncbi:MAG: hypothetical protein H6Q89_5287, partial [Myxococcaceae bacterium]|nr:hypothetical protein [Myxococcaceae bacterium]